MLRPTTAKRTAIALSNDHTPNLLLFIEGRFDHEPLKLEISSLLDRASNRANRVSAKTRSDLVALQYYIERGHDLKYVRWEKKTYAPWATSIPKG